MGLRLGKMGFWWKIESRMVDLMTRVGWCYVGRWDGFAGIVWEVVLLDEMRDVCPARYLDLEAPSEIIRCTYSPSFTDPSYQPLSPLSAPLKPLFLLFPWIIPPSSAIQHKH